MRCEDARTAYLSGESTPKHREHLRACPACSPLLPGLETTRQLLEEDAVWEQPTPKLEERIVRLITEDQAAPEPKPVAARWWWPAAAVAATVVLVAGAWAVLRSPNPDWEVALPGTAVAPLADGTVRGWNEAAGTRILLDIDGLAAAPAGSVYEVWFSREALHISAGTFTAGGTVEMWTGVARRDYPRIWITLEPLDEDESPSGVVVMDTDPFDPGSAGPATGW